MNERQGITATEILFFAAVVFCLLAVALPQLKPSQMRQQSGKGSLADLRRIEAAKDQYAAEHHSKPGDPVSMAQLVQGGYLTATPHSLPPGSQFVIGRVGTPVTITSEPDRHDDPE